jgi:hydroxymethylglutaryl-CoA lyase
MNLPAQVKLREVAPRDGFQSLAQFIATGQKLQIIEALGRAGVREFETTSFVSAKAIPQLADGAALMARVPRAGLTHAALIATTQGARNALAAGVDQLVVVTSATEAHNQANVRRSVAASLAQLDDIGALAAGREVPVIGAVAVAFGCPFQGEVAEQEVLRVASAFMAGGAAAVILADTTGMATPPRVERLVRRCQDQLPRIELVLHLHNNRGTAMANLFAALLCGVTRFDTALGGIGGCPNVPQAAGNLPTEDVVCLLEDMGVATGIDLEACIVAARLLESIVGSPLPGQVMKSGPRKPRAGGKVCDP